jgi:hypothetical protein
VPHDIASEESFSSPLRDLGLELMLYSGIVTTERLRMVVNHGQARNLGFVWTSSPGMGGMTHGMWVHISRMSIV